jgi:hypothetical protein
MKTFRLSLSTFLIASALSLATFAARGDNKAPKFQDQPRVRIGALCNDGTESQATGSGACSHHGGVSCWRYSDGTCTKP